MPSPIHLVVPCFNEAARLPVAAFREGLARFPSLSCGFVDDGSTDGTSEVLETLRASFPDRVTVLRLPENVGKGETVRAGLLAPPALASPFSGYWDADLATPLETAFDFLADLERDPALLLVLGSRVQTLGSRVDRRPSRHYLGRVMATCISRTLGLPVYDTQCGAKLFRVTPLLAPLLEEPFSTRWLFDVEILARMVRLHRLGRLPPVDVVAREHPLPRWSEVAGSKVRASDFPRALWGLRRIRRRYLRDAGPVGTFTARS